MKKLIAAGNLYLKHINLADVALLKLCVWALGVLVGLKAARRHRRGAGILAGIVFLVTYVPLMSRFLSALVRTEE